MHGMDVKWTDVVLPVSENLFITGYLGRYPIRFAHNYSNKNPKKKEKGIEFELFECPITPLVLAK